MDHLWYENAVFYGVDIRRFQDSNGDGFGDIQGLIGRLDYLKDLGIDALWLLPFMDTPLKDNGYDVRDYYRVDPRVGTLADFKQLLVEVHKRHMYVVMDLVMNHTSDEHPWFEASRLDPASRYRDYYIWTDRLPDTSLGGETIFPGEEKNVWSYDEEAKAYYYHRFYSFQPELRSANPHVQAEIFKALDFWLAMGVDGFRIDALPIMLEPKGLPGTEMRHPHRLVEDIHDFTFSRKREAVLLGEVNVPLKDMDKFFGDDSQMNMLFNFHIGPHIMLALANENAEPIYSYLENALDPPARDQWLNFLRHHDELTMDMMPEEQREKIFSVFAPDADMRIYGRGIRRRMATMLSEGLQETQRAEMELAFSFLFATPGTPMIFYGDEIGMGDDLALEGRNAVRTPMQWSDQKNGGFSTAAADKLIAPVIQEGPFGYPVVNVESEQADEESFLNWMKKLIEQRRGCKEIGFCEAIILEQKAPDQRVIAHFYPRFEPVPDSKPAAFLHNFSPDEVSVALRIPKELKFDTGPKVKIGRGEIKNWDGEVLEVRLPGYGYAWL